MTSMAIEAASSSSSSSSKSYTYDVFLSFRGEDTRCNFTDHLYNALRHKGINTFIDAKLPRGEEISAELVKAIEESRVSIIIFSENYASSRWCLDELVKIIQCRASKKQMVRPVFYKVDPSDVRNQSGSFGEAFAKLDQCRYKDSIGKWREALSEVANLSGWPFPVGEYEFQFISKIAEEVSSQLVNSYNLVVAKYPVGIDSCTKDVHKLLDMEKNLEGSRTSLHFKKKKDMKKNNVCMVDMEKNLEGSRTSLHFKKKKKDMKKNNVCMVDMEKNLESSHTSLHFKKEKDMKKNNVCMVGIWGAGGIGKSTIARAVFNSIRHEFEGSCFLANVRSNLSLHQGLAHLQQTLLFDILRDSTLKVHNLDEGINFIGKRMRDKKVLLILDDVSDSKQLDNLLLSSDCFGPGSKIIITTRDKHLLTAHQVHSIYEVKLLNDAEALELFSWNAFNCKRPPNGFVELANRAVHYARGLPLALTVVGHHLFARRKEHWDDALDSYKRVPHKNIQDILKISFDALEDYVKELFLDLACFFKGWYVDRVIPILIACDRNPVIGIELLKEKALITLDKCKIWMHDLIEEMGKEIVRQQGEPGKRSRLWNFDDIDHVLTDNTGTKKIKGIQVEGQVGKRICLNAKSFSKMKYLKYLVSNYPVKYSGNIDYLSNELRFLHWYGCSMQSFPPNFQPRKLVVLKIPNSPHITQLWEGLKNFPILTSMDLKGCKSLRELPNFTGIPNLEELNFDHCESLVEVHHSVGFLDKLKTLSAKGCCNLVKLPTEFSLKSLLAMDLSDCTRLEEFPKIMGKMDSVEELNLSCTGVKELHPSIGNLIGLNQLCLVDCKNLTTIPCSIYELQNLEILDLSGCSNLVTFPTKATISSHDHDSSSLALSKLRVLRINGCNLSTADFIGSLDCLETLTELDLSSNNFVSVSALSKFVNLPRIDLHCCKGLREIPELPPNTLEVNAKDCESLERFLIWPKSLKMPEMLLWNCHRFSYSLGYDMEKMKNILLNNQKSRFSLVLPGSEVPKWFHFSKEVGKSYGGRNRTCAISFQIPSKMNWENIGVAFCFVEGAFRNFIDHRADISINGILIDQRSNPHKLMPRGHMWLTYIPLCDEIKGKVDQKGWSRYHCQVEVYPAYQMKSCGVYVVCQPPNEYSNKSGMLGWLSLSIASPSWLSLTSETPKRHRSTEEPSPTPVNPPKRQCTAAGGQASMVPMFPDLHSAHHSTTPPQLQLQEEPTDLLRLYLNSSVQQNLMAPVKGDQDQFLCLHSEPSTSEFRQ